MSIIESTAQKGRVRSISNGRWQRIVGEDARLFRQMRERYGADLAGAASASFYTDEEFTYIPATFVDRDGEGYQETRIVIAVSDRVVVTVEPGPSCAPLDLAVARMERDGREDDNSFEIVASILQAVSDATDGLVSGLNNSTEKMMIQTNSILRSLETKKARDFGVSDVTSTQQELADMEELLSRCMVGQLALAEAAHHIRAKLHDRPTPVRTDLGRLIDDIEAIEQHIEFVHDRVRLLQQTNNLALNVKQNQIIKVFSVVTAVFLPVMLLSTYYSMNFEFMPILSWQYAEPAIILLSFVFAMLPLIYVRRRGWLR